MHQSALLHSVNTVDGWCAVEFGRESSTVLENMSSDQVLDAVKSLSQK